MMNFFIKSKKVFFIAIVVLASGVAFWFVAKNHWGNDSSTYVYEADTNSNRGLASDKSEASQSESRKSKLWKAFSSQTNKLWDSKEGFGEIDGKELAVFSLKANKDIIVSLTGEKGLPAFKISQTKEHVEKVKKAKKAILSQINISKRKENVFKAHKVGKNLVIYTKGTYIDTQKKKVLFEEWNIYFKKRAIHVLVHLRKKAIKDEQKAIDTLVKDIIQSYKGLKRKDKKAILAVIQKGKE